jgi:hypothetical protein
MRLVVPPADQLKPDTPIRLAVAAAIAFPDGSMSASGLREAARGHLVIERIADKDYTTLASIERMRESYRVESSPSSLPPCGPEGQARRAKELFGIVFFALFDPSDRRPSHGPLEPQGLCEHRTLPVPSSYWELA